MSLSWTRPEGRKSCRPPPAAASLQCPALSAPARQTLLARPAHLTPRILAPLAPAENVRQTTGKELGGATAERGGCGGDGRRGGGKGKD
eukprot:747430-Hanusia_phi.AAC.1